LAGVQTAYQNAKASFFERQLLNVVSAFGIGADEK
jgi:hypothetical protein